MTPALTVVVPTRDRPDHLHACLDHLRRELRPADELLVVDSASRVPVQAAGARVLRTGPGASVARNAGWRAAGAAVVAFVDDDVRVSPGWRDALERALVGVAAVCGRVDAPVGTERPVAVTPDVTECLVTPGAHDVLGVSANLAVRTDSLAAVGGFDERLGPGTWFAAAEDKDLLDRLLTSGARIRYAPDVLARHEQWRTRRQLLRLDWGYGKGAGARVTRVGRTDLARAARLAHDALWTTGLRPALGDLRAGYQFGVLTGLIRTAGTLVGLLAATMHPGMHAAMHPDMHLAMHPDMHPVRDDGGPP